MKSKVKVAVCILLVVAISVASCKKDKSVSPVVTPPANVIKAKVLEYGTDQPLAGTDIYVCTSPAGLTTCAGNYLKLTTDANGECSFTADSFTYGWVDKADYWQNFFNPCFVTYFRKDTLSS